MNRPAGKAPAGKGSTGKAPAGKGSASKAPLGKGPANKTPANKTMKKHPNSQRELRRFDFNRNRASRARLLAYECLWEIRLRNSFAHEMIEKLIDSSNMDASDKAFAAKLVIGVVSMRGTLDDILDRAMNSPDDVSAEVRDALVISVYEIIYLQKSPHAAVDQGVELTRAVAPPAAGLANSVLRKVVALKPSFPFGDPRTDIDAYARLHGFPAWLVKELISDLGPASAHAFLVASNTTAPLFVAVNDVRDANGEVYETLVRAKAEPEPELIGGKLLSGCYRVSKHAVLNDGRIKRLVNKGCMLVSDAAAQAVAELVASCASPTSFLEVGAGRGTKTVMLQSGMFRLHGKQAANFVCVDNVERKVSLLQSRAAKYGIHVQEAIAANGLHLDKAIPGRLFETVFIDAPCTGLGTLRRHPEIRWRVSEKAISEYGALGERLMRSAAPFVAPGGILAFSTCTVTKRENEGAVQAFLESEEGSCFTLEPPQKYGGETPYFKTELATDGPDAHFCAILRKGA